MNKWAPHIIISGGQTGADRGALDAAIALGIEHGGWCPHERAAEDGVIPPQYQLKEVGRMVGLAGRTKLNVAMADATIIFIRGTSMTPGSRLTADYAYQTNKPYVVVGIDDPKLAKFVRTWLAGRAPKILNVAGSRESKAPGMQRRVRDTLVEAIGGRGRRMKW